MSQLVDLSHALAAVTGVQFDRLPRGIGWQMLMLGRMPQIGDAVTWENWRFEVVDMDGKRVDKVLATQTAAAAAPDDGFARSDA